MKSLYPMPKNNIKDNTKTGVNKCPMPEKPTPGGLPLFARQNG
jgi:hypothetical protein